MSKHVIVRLVLGLIITILIWAGIWWGLSSPAGGAVPHWSVGVAPERFKRAMRYHGILSAEWSWDRQEYGFWRDGKWCSLFRSMRGRV